MFSAEHKLAEYNTRLAALRLTQHYHVESLDEDIVAISPTTSTNVTLALMALTHGDEVVGLEVFNRLLSQLEQETYPLTVKLILILANIPAFLNHRRYLDFDLNRAYGDGESIPGYEGARVQAIKAALQKADYLIDFHQTMHQTQTAFFITPHHPASIRFASQLAALPVIVHPENKPVSTSTTYLAAQKRPAVTIELGAVGITDEQVSLGLRVIRSACDAMFADTQPKQSNKNACYQVIYHEPYHGGKVDFQPSAINFTDVRVGDSIAFCAGQAICAPHSGKLLVYPPFWFADNYHKPDGIFAILQRIELP